MTHGSKHFGVAELPLRGVKVVDCGVIFAGPLAATYLADFGAEVLKIEHPQGDPLRIQGPTKDGTPLWFKVVSRNKRNVTLDLSCERGQELFLRLVEDADVVVESFRPGTLERWDIGPEELHVRNPRLVILRTSGFGQTGPYRRRPGFGTLAEAMSGFAHMNGWPDRPPSLPPFGLADTLAASFGAMAVLVALHERDVAGSGRGQVIDCAIVEPILSIGGSSVIIHDQLGTIPERTGNRSPLNAPRNCYRSSDGHYVAMSASSQSTAQRAFEAIERPELIEDERFVTAERRIENSAVLDEIIGEWMAAHTRAEILERFEQLEGTVAPVYDVADVLADPHFREREVVVSLDDPELGRVRLPNVVPKLSRTPGSIRWAGRPAGADNDRVYGALGYSPEELAVLREDGVI